MRLSVHVMVDSKRSAAGTEFFVEYKPVEKAGSKSAQAGARDTLNLLPADEAIDLTLGIDNTLTEAFGMGACAKTVVTKTSSGGRRGHCSDQASRDAGVSFLRQAPRARLGKLVRIWVTADEVRRTPRHDRRSWDLGA